MRFVPPGPADPYYEIGVFESGRVATRPESLHDWFNALAWLAFPRTKARITLLREEWHAPERLPFGAEELVPLRAGESIPWKLV